MSFVEIESKASKKEGKKSKKAEPTQEALLCQRSCSPRRRDSFTEVKLKLKKLKASGLPRRRQPLPRRSKTLTEVKEESLAGKGLGFIEAKKTFAKVKGDHLDF